MAIDWHLVARIAGPVIGAFVGWGLARAFERRSKLVTYYGHVGAFKIKPTTGAAGEPPPPPFPVHAHTVVIRNAGRKAAKNVRVMHAVLPRDFSIFPAVNYTVEELEGGTDIVIAELVPGQQVTINYMYPATMTWDQTTQGVKSEDGFAKMVNVLPTPQPERWVVIGSTFLFAVGGIAVVYLMLKLAAAAWARFGP